jgi:hypothetical protein
MATATITPMPTTLSRVDRRYIVQRQGREFVLYAGLLDLTHRTGL